MGQVLAKQGVRGDLDGALAVLDHLAPGALGDGTTALDEHLAVGKGHVDVGVFLAVLVLAHLAQHALAVEQVFLVLIEVVEDVRLGHAHGLEQDGGGHFAAAVDADVQDVLVVEVEVQPGAAHGDDAAGVQNLAAGVRLAGVVLEDDAGRALQLVDDDALGAVNDEGALVGHQRQGAEIDVLFLDVADGAAAGLFVDIKNHQAHDEAQGGFIGQALGKALVLVILGVLDDVADILQAGGAVEVLNGENGTENGFKAEIGAAGRWFVALQEFQV